MQLTLTLGKRWLDEPIVLHLIDLPDVEFGPDDVFVAANRIEDKATDIANLPHSWQRQLRHSIDAVEAPSMSVDDTIEVMSESGTYLGGWKCAPVGWTYIERAA